jgi:uncharacterized membrane protein YfcA
MSGAEPLWAGLAGVVVGFLTAVLGGGGGLFIVPVLVYGFGRTPADAAGTSLAATLTSAVVGLVGHLRRGYVQLRTALIFGVATMIGAAGGSRLHRFLSDRATMLIFAAVLFGAGARMAIGKPGGDPDAGGDRRPKLALLGPLGLVIGALSGLLGVSGGFLMVPVLVYGAGLGLYHAIGTSVAVVVLGSTSGVVSHALLGHLDLGFTFSVLIGAVIGGALGVPLAGKLPERPLRLGFTALVTGAGIYVLARTL